MSARGVNMVARFWRGETLEDIGLAWGLTRERVRQLLALELGARYHDVKRINSTARGVARRVRVDPVGRHCRVCNRRFVRPEFYKVCSTECSVLWRVARYHIDPQSRADLNRNSARSLLRRNDISPSQRRWAERVLNGLPTDTGAMPHLRSKKDPASALQRAVARVMELRAAVELGGNQ